MKRKLLICLFSLGLVIAVQGCAVIWVADTAVDTAAFAVGTATKVTWEAGKAVGDLAVPDDEDEDEEEN